MLKYRRSLLKEVRCDEAQLSYYLPYKARLPATVRERSSRLFREECRPDSSERRKRGLPEFRLIRNMRRRETNKRYLYTTACVGLNIMIISEVIEYKTMEKLNAEKKLTSICPYLGLAIFAGLFV